MTPQVLQVTYTFNGSRAEFEHGLGPVASEIARVPGLRWKIWLFDETTSRGGGTYLFDDASALHAFVDGPIVAALKSNPAFSNITAQVFSVLDEPTAVTRGPVPATTAR